MRWHQHLARLRLALRRRQPATSARGAWAIDAYLRRAHLFHLLRGQRLEYHMFIFIATLLLREARRQDLQVSGATWREIAGGGWVSRTLTSSSIAVAPAAPSGSASPSGSSVTVASADSATAPLAMASCGVAAPIPRVLGVGACSVD